MQDSALLAKGSMWTKRSLSTNHYKDGQSRWQETYIHSVKAGDIFRHSRPRMLSMKITIATLHCVFLVLDLRLTKVYEYSGTPFLVFI